MCNNHQNGYNAIRTSVNYVMECIEPENMSRLTVTTQFFCPIVIMMSMLWDTIFKVHNKSLSVRLLIELLNFYSRKSKISHHRSN